MKPSRAMTSLTIGWTHHKSIDRKRIDTGEVMDVDILNVVRQDLESTY